MRSAARIASSGRKLRTGSSSCASGGTALGACLFMSLTSGIVMSAEKVMSKSPATKARMRVERFSMTFHSIASR